MSEPIYSFTQPVVTVTTGADVTYHKPSDGLCRDCGVVCGDLLCQRCKRLVTQATVINELVLALRDVTSEMWGNVDADEVILHLEPDADPAVVHVSRKTAAAYWRAANLLAKHGGNQ